MRGSHAHRAAAAALVVAALVPLPALAGLFDDEEARRQIIELNRKADERFDTASRAQLELAKQIESLNAEIAKLRGQNEVLTHELDASQKRQRDFYVDLDTRLRKLETTVAENAAAAAKAAADAAAAAAAATAPAKPKADPAAEARDYEAALDLFKQKHFKDAVTSFESFLANYAESARAPSAQYWLGNAYHVLGDCKKAVEAHNVVVAKWPTSPRAPEALLEVAACQQEGAGGAAAARRTLESIVANYPGTPAADTAKTQLKPKKK